MDYQKENDQSDLIIGIRPVIEAIESGREIDNVFIQDGLKGPLAQDLKKILNSNGIIFKLVPVEKLNRITRKNHQGVIAFISPVSFQHIEDILPNVFESGKIPLIVVLDRITDVRNFGAISRSCECAGVDAIVVPSRGNAPVNFDAVKAAAGALFHIPVCKENNIKNTLEYLKESGLQIIACTEKGDEYFYQVDFTLPTAIIMGSEDEGISPEYLKRSDKKIKIPMQGKTASLNVSVATGIIVFEAVKQRMV